MGGWIVFKMSDMLKIENGNAYIIDKELNAKVIEFIVKELLLKSHSMDVDKHIMLKKIYKMEKYLKENNIVVDYSSE